MTVGRLKLYIHKPRVVLAGQVDQSTFEYPIAEVTVDNLSEGIITAARPGMTVVFGTQPGYSDRGRTRIRALGTGSTLRFARSPRGRNPDGGAEGGRDGEVDLEDDLYFEVWEDRRVWPKIQAILPDGEGVKIFKDGNVQVQSFQSRPDPVANGGPARAGTAHGDPLGREFSFSAAASLPVHTGSSITGYDWNPGDGAVTGGSLTGPNVSLVFPPGFRYVELTVTDSDSGTHTTHIPVVVDHPDEPITVESFEILTHVLTAFGAELAVRIHSALDALEYPDGTLVILWEDESAGPSDHSHMRFVGWHHHDPGDIAATDTAALSDVVFDCLDVAGKLKTVPGFGQEVENVAIASRWYQMEHANVDKYLVYLLHWHSTALEVAPFTWTGTGSDYNFIVLGSAPDNLFAQVQAIAHALIPPRHFTCNSRGELHVLVDPMLQDVAARTSTIQRTITPDLWRDIRALHTRPVRVGKLHGGAIVATHTPLVNDEGQEYPPTVFCVAPGQDAWGHGMVEQRHERHLTPSQALLNISIGHLYARLNPLEDRFAIHLSDDEWPSIEPADMTWINLEVPVSLTTPRLRGGVARMLPHTVNMSYEHSRTGVLRNIEISAENETRGIPAETVFVGGEPPEPQPDPPPSLFIMGGLSGTYRIQYSTDGDTWVGGNHGSSKTFQAVAWSPELQIFCASGGGGSGDWDRVSTSPDGINWTARETTRSNASFVGVVWAQALERFIIISNINAAFVDSGGSGGAATSPDGINWTAHTLPKYGLWRSLAWSPALGLACAVGNFSGTEDVLTSPDGETWTIRDSSHNLDWSSVIWVAELGLFVAVGSGVDVTQAVMTSPDGINWTARDTPEEFNEGIRGVTWSPKDELLVAPAYAPSSNAIATSPDGINWTRQTILPTSRIWNSAAWSPSMERLFISSTGGTPDGCFSDSATTGWQQSSDMLAISVHFSSGF